MIWYQRNRGNKYRAKSCIYDDIQYHSKFEAGYAQGLDYRKKAGDIKDWDRQFKVSIDINGHHICNYYVDFRIFHSDGSIELVECKGMVTPVWDLKRKLLEAVYLPENPDVKYTVVK